MTTLARDVSALDATFTAVTAAHAANDPVRWTEAHGSLAQQLASATKALARAQSHAGDLVASDVAGLHAAERSLEAHARAATDLGSAPTGFRAVANEAEMLAALTGAAAEGAQRGFAAKEAELRARFDALSAIDRAELSRRLAKHLRHDELAVAFTTRLTPERQHRLRSYLSQPQQRGPVAVSAPAAVAPASPPEPETMDARLRRALDEGTDSLVGPRLIEVFASLDGTTRRELARRLESYRPGRGDDIAARFARLDRSLQQGILETLHDTQRAASAAPLSSSTAADLPLTASVYAREHLVEIIAAVERDLLRNGLPQPHARLRWTSQKAAITAIVAQLRAYLEADPGKGATRLYELAYPADLWTLIDDRRGATAAEPAHPRVSPTDISHGPVGPRAWEPQVGIEVAAALDHALGPAIQRMGMRMRVQLDNPVHVAYSSTAAAALTAAAESGLTTADVVASTPLDSVIANVLASDELVHGIKAKHGDDTPGRPFANGLRRVDLAWQGARDPKLWNWIRVDSPRDATAEDVAFTLYTDFGDATATPRSDQAYQIQVAAPYFGIPIETARTFKAAWDHAPQELKQPFATAPPSSVDLLGLARSGVADDLALAQAPPVVPAADTEHALDRVALQLAFLRTKLQPWQADASLAGAFEFLARRQHDGAKDPAATAHWTPAVVAQETALHAIASDLARIFRDLDSRGATPADATGLAPVVDVLNAYAAAAGLSHLPAQASAALARARQLSALLPLALAEDRVRQTRALVQEQRAAQVEAGFVEQGARDPIASLAPLSERAADLRTKANRGAVLDPEAVERLGIDADEMSLRARLAALGARVHMIQKRGHDAHRPQEKISGDGFWTVEGGTTLLYTKIRHWNEMLDQGKHWSGPTAGKTAAQADAHNLRTTITRVEQAMVAFDEKNKIGEFLNWALDDISDSLARDALLKIAAELGVMIVTGQIASAGVSALRGFALAREGMLAADIIGEARGLGVGFAALEVVTHAGMITVAQGAMGGKMGPRELAENALGIAMSNIAMRPFAKLLKNAAKAEEEIRTFAQLAKRSGRALLRGGVDLGVNVAVAGAAHYVTHFDQFEMASSEEWVTQAFGLLASKFVHERTVGTHQRIEHAAKASGTKAFEGLQKKLALLETAAAKGSKSTSPETATHLLEQSHALLLEEKLIHEQLASQGHPDAADAKAVDADLHALGGDFIEVPFQLAGLKPVVDGEIYAGTAKQAEAAVESARRMGVHVEEVLGTEKGTRKLAIGDREITVHVEESQGRAPKRTVDDFLGTPASATELTHAREQAAQEDSRTLADQAQLIQRGRARSEREMLLAIKNGEMPRYIARASPASTYPTFGNPKKPFLFATEPADLRGITPAEAMWKVGWTEEWIRDSIGKEIEVTIMDTKADAPGSTVRASVAVGTVGWADLKRVALVDPLFVDAAEAKGLTSADLTELFADAETLWTAETTPTNPIKNRPKMRVLLSLLDDMYSVNYLYTSIGATMDVSGSVGARELMVERGNTGFELSEHNHQKVSLGIMRQGDFDALFPSAISKREGGS